MLRNRHLTGLALTAALLAAIPRAEAESALASLAQQEQGGAAQNAPGKLTVTVGKSLIIDSPMNIQRISVANGDLVEAVAVNPKEVLINGKQPGDTSLIIWQQNGSRLIYDLTVRMSPAKLDAVRDQLAREFPNDNINVTYENDTAFVRGTVKDVTAADRVMSIASTLGKTVNLLRVEVPPVDTQILLKVKFANVDRSARIDLGINLASGALNQTTSVTTGQFTPITVAGNSNTVGGKTANTTQYSVADALNIFMFRPDLNLAATIKALQARNLLEMLAEPNVLAIDGKPASFVSGGEFPFPMLQGGAGVGAVTIAFREYGIRLNFLPVVTPRGTIRLQVAPEVSSLDFAHAVTFEGFTIPALSTRRVQTEVELDAGQSFVIAGLLDNEETENFNKIPGIGDIPILGKLFQTKSVSRSNTELLVIVTPEIVRPIPANQPVPTLNYPGKFLKPNSNIEMRQPGISQTGPVPVQPPSDSIPVEQLEEKQRPGQAGAAPTVPPFQLVPVPVPQAAPSPNPGLTAPPLAQNTGGPGK
ncbi:MAG TPA: pilus assembly protein N-terminal domain-containing protein [Bryobacteraceae bacterium]|nr:pilus assembly protein N-terminal domain-containing protein [Bryobacteraceae bacterium]